MVASAGQAGLKPRKEWGQRLVCVRQSYGGHRPHFGGCGVLGEFAGEVHGAPSLGRTGVPGAMETARRQPPSFPPGRGGAGRAAESGGPLRCEGAAPRTPGSERPLPACE